MALTLLHHPPIPLPTTSLVGRDAELGRILAMLADPAIRLVTITGPGGVGKTRLALQVAHDIDPAIAGEVVFALLAAATDAESVLAAISRALGISHVDSLSLEHAIDDRRMTLILDNAEHVVAHLTMLAALLQHCPNLKIVVTSQVMLRLSAEHVFPVDPLPTSSAGADTPAPATALFIERARALRPDLPLDPTDIAAIDEICRQVDGLPLAIELAAARTRFLSPSVLRDRLSERLPVLVGGPRDAPERHQTLRATLRWSHDLLSDDEKALFRRLTVFRNSAPYDSVEAVCNAAGTLGGGTEELLAELVDHSLVRITDRPATGPRVRLLNTIREFAREELERSDDLDATREAHARWFAHEVTRQPYQNWGTGREELRDWTMRREPDHENLLAALEHLAPKDDPDTIVQIVSNLIPFWLELGTISDARVWTQRVQPLAPRVSTEHRMRIEYMTAVMALYSDELDEAESHARRAVDLAIEIDHTRMVANGHNLLGSVYWMQGNAAEGERLQRLAVATMRSTNDALGGAMYLANIGEHLGELGDLERAEPLLREALPVIARHRPDALPLFQGSLANLALRRGDLDEASGLLASSLDYHREPPHRQPHALGVRLCDAAEIAARRGQAEAGARLLGAATALFTRSGMLDHKESGKTRDRARRALEPHLEAEAIAREVALGKTMTIPEAIALALEIAQTRPDDREEAASPAAGIGLTDRQLDVLRLLAEGKSNPAIAGELFISERTVTTHLTRIYDRLGVTTRTEAVARAAQLGLTSVTSP
jgi:predicted ATPase/DNA-binding CsgD family transcriptional regulator